MKRNYTVINSKELLKGEKTMTVKELKTKLDDLNRDLHNLSELIDALEKHGFFYSVTLDDNIREDIRRYRELESEFKITYNEVYNEYYRMKDREEN